VVQGEANHHTYVHSSLSFCCYLIATAAAQEAKSQFATGASRQGGRAADPHHLDADNHHEGTMGP